ncbi:YihY/virulence factor BrkB family protein [Plantactinospora sp. KLBMP9567]|uniref:YihY/virulence factor BrkB family protein n=1 Tax=Plantactinospora sp. KLBMP9567 TaxID=3085900 RepID=UPI00298280AB|nr:YihY/virulence factor BrkB family protein [Plantactinospora sp. KLBMP9567]MDW5322332.1 YihY/virulence factor BrkB family protein [Plantactinospora sp. KLBMP9567]
MVDNSTDRAYRDHQIADGEPTGVGRGPSASQAGSHGAGQAPDQPTTLGVRGWWGVLRRTVREFGDDRLTDWAAALTYYAVLSIFPGLLVLVSVLGLVGDSVLQPLIDDMGRIAPGPVGEILKTGTRNLIEAQGAAGLFAVIGLVVALWSASGYIAAFMRASNAIYDVPEGRPIWKTLPIRIAVTIVVGILLAVSALMVVFTGKLAEWVGDALGAGSALITGWNVAKWPILVVLVSLMFAILYWAAPNARQGGFRWITPGGLVAVVVWIIASAGFAFYVANFGTYNKTYGILGGVVIFFVWLWISNLALLLGAEFDAELHRGRAIADGHPEDEEPFVELRDTRKIKKGRDRGLA